ncbi:MAG: hypothetical protein NTV86_22705 [Planctomycetota bacterium]|nr:hypothetical protein [Planctomycetota bacterium]
MDHRRSHLWEKLHVEAVALAALAGVYYWLWPALAAGDPQTAVAFLPPGHLGDVAGLLVVLLACAAVCSAVTIAARPLGSMLAALVGVAGICCRSPGARTLFWQSPQLSPAGIMLLLAGEVLLLGVLFSLAAFVVEFVRSLVARLAGGLTWKDPLAQLTEQEREAMIPESAEGQGVADAFLPGPLQDLFVHFGRKGSRDAGRRHWDARMLGRCLACAVTGSVLAAVVLLIFIQSSERGQVLFALLISFLIGALVAHQRFPAPYSMVAVLMAACTGALFYLTAAIASVGSGPNAWILAPVHAGPGTLPYAAALPIDWVAAGGGGAVIGFWISERIHEARYLSDDAGILKEGQV